VKLHYSRSLNPAANRACGLKDGTDITETWTGETLMQARPIAVSNGAEKVGLDAPIGKELLIDRGIVKPGHRTAVSAGSLQCHGCWIFSGVGSKARQPRRYRTRATGSGENRRLITQVIKLCKRKYGRS